MSTGPEHYAEAEQLLVLARDRADHGFQERADFIVSRAAVHAQLAMVAAHINTKSSPEFPLAEPPSAYADETTGPDLTWKDVVQ